MLAGELSATGGDHAAAFTRYGSALRPYVRQAQKLPPGAVRGFLPRTRTAIALRDASMRAMTRWPLRAATARRFRRAVAIRLAEYAPVA